jgi:hypothetical protein
LTITGGFNDSKPESVFGAGFSTAGGGVLIPEAADHTTGATVPTQYEEQLLHCPACETLALVSGTLNMEFDEDWDHREGILVGVHLLVRFTPDGLLCRACHLDLPEVAGSSPVAPVETSAIGILCCPLGRQIGPDYTDFSPQGPKRAKTARNRSSGYRFQADSDPIQGDREHGVQLHEMAGGQGSSCGRRRMQEEPSRRRQGAD